MNVSQDLSILHLIPTPAPVVQVVMALLAGVSFMSWYYIFRSGSRCARRAQDRAVRARLLEPAATSTTSTRARSTTATAPAAWSASSKPASANSPSCAARRTSTRKTSSTVRAAPCAPPTSARSTASTRTRLPRLGRLGQPYVGLFGTVWGIMHAFRGLSNVGQATLPFVARHRRGAGRHRHRSVRRHSGRHSPYNRFSHDIDRLAVRYESFMEEFSTSSSARCGKPMRQRRLKTKSTSSPTST